MELYKFSQLSDDEQKKAKEFFQLIDILKTFNNQANPNLFKFLFEERWEHLWEIFVNQCNHNLLDFFNRIDISAKSMIISNIVKYESWSKVYPDKSLLYSQC